MLVVNAGQLTWWSWFGSRSNAAVCDRRVEGAALAITNNMGFILLSLGFHVKSWIS